MELDSDYSFPENDNYKYKIDHLKSHLTEELINIRLISQSEFLVFQKKEIQLYAIDKKDKINKKCTFRVNSIIKDILIKNNELIASTLKGIIIFEKNKQNKYIEKKRIKPQNNEIYYSLLDLKDGNLIGAFSVSFLNIIDLKTSNIISHFKFNSSNKGRIMKYNVQDIDKEEEEGNKDGDNNEKQDIEKMDKDNEDEDYDDDVYQNKRIIKEKLTLESFDPRAKPFLIKQKNIKAYLICFKLLTYCIILNHKKMKILKKFDFTDIFGFHLFKPDNEYDHFYILIIDSYKNPNFIVQKYNSDLIQIDQFKNTSFEFPNWNPYVEEGMEDDASTSTLICEHECLYKNIVYDIKNFSFLYHKYVGPPVDIEYYILIHCVDGKFKNNIKLGMNSYDCDDLKLSFDIRGIGENKFILVKADEDKGIEKIEIEYFPENEDDKKKIKKSKKKKEIINKKTSYESESNSDFEEDKKDRKMKKKKKVNKKKEMNIKLLGKKKEIEKDNDEISSSED